MSEGNERKEFERRHPKLERFLYNFVRFTMWASVVILTILIIRAPSEAEMTANTPEYVHPKSYYTLMYAESILGCIVIYLPRKVEKSFHIAIPSYMMVPFEIFLYCAIFLGEVRQFYYTHANWDTFLHFFSAGMLATLAFSIVSLLNRSDKVPVNLSPLFLSIFAFTFAVACGAIWEIYEYTFDGLLGMNMQKFETEAGVQFVGRAALKDTMDDIITDVIGAFLVSLVGYLLMRKYSVKVLDGTQLKVDKQAAAEDKEKKMKKEETELRMQEEEKKAIQNEEKRFMG